MPLYLKSCICQIHIWILITKKVAQQIARNPSVAILTARHWAMRLYNPQASK